MTNFWQWFLTIGGAIIFIANVVLALIQLTKHLKNGKRNADSHFERRVLKIIDERLNPELDKILQAREIEFKIMQEFISAELAPIREDIGTIKALNQNLQHATINDLKIKLRSLYHDSFEVNGVLTTIEKSNWDKWFSDYTLLGGNSDVKTMNDHIQKVYLEITLEKQKQKANRKKKGVEQI